MLKMITAFTNEVDNPEEAVREILGQINGLSDVSFGLISCHSDFISSKAVKIICESLPFDVIGCTSTAVSSNGKNDIAALTLSVITGNNIKISGIFSDPLSKDYDAAVRSACESAIYALGEKPVMCFAYAPLIFNLGGDQIVASLDRHCGGAPIFGTLAVDHNANYSTAQTVYNGKTSYDRCALMFISGDISPKFAIASINEDKIQKQRVIITKSQGNILMEVNDMPITTYLGKLGIMSDNKIIGANIIPFMVDHNDGTKPVARAVFAATPEGHIVCGGSVPVNATLGIGSIDYEDILLTSKEKTDEINKNLGVTGILMFSCIARYLCLGVDIDAEMITINNVIGAKHPFQFAYSGGEICPVYTSEGKVVNRFHNYTLAVCVF